jgi:hypothetical protein
MQCRRLQPHIFYFPAAAFYKSKLLTHSGLLNSEWRPKLIDLQHFSRVSDGIASMLFSHSFCEPNEIAIESEVEFKALSKLTFLHHRKDREHNSSKIYKYDNLYPRFFSTTHRKC